MEKHAIRGNRKDARKPITIAALTAAAFLLLGATANAASAYEIYTYGSGDFVAQVLVGVALMFSGNVIQALVKVILLVGLLTVIISPVSSWLSRGTPVGPTGGEGFIAILRQTLLAVIAVYIFILPKADVAIIDRLDPGQNQVVSEVPLVQAIMAHGASLIGDTVGKEMETAFSLPDSLKFQNGGIGLGIKYIDTIFSIQPPSSNTPTDEGSMPGALISESLRQYFNQCVFPQFSALDGAGDPKSTALYGMMTTGDLLTYLGAQNIFLDPNITITAPVAGGYTTCDQAIPAIRSAWTGIMPYWIKEVEYKLLGYTTLEKGVAGSGALSTSILPHYFTGTTLDAQSMLQTIAIGNLMRQAAVNYNSIYGDPSVVATTMATNTTVAGWQTTARMFGAIVQTMRNVFEGLVYGLSVLLPVAVAVAGLAPIGTYAKIVLWLQLWIPFYVLLNLFADMELSRAINSITQISAGQISVNAWAQVGEKAQLSLGYVGSLAFTVPMFAWGLLKGGEYAVSSAIGALVGGGGAAQTAASVGGQVSGIGNVNVGNRSVDSTSARRFTTASSAVAFETGAGHITADMSAAQRFTGGSLTEMGHATQSYNRAAMMGTVAGMGDHVFETKRTAGQVETGNAKAMDERAAHHGLDNTTAQQVIATGHLGERLAANKELADKQGINRLDAAAGEGDVKGKMDASETFKTQSYLQWFENNGISTKGIGEMNSRQFVAATAAAGMFSTDETVRNKAFETVRSFGLNKGELEEIKKIGTPAGVYEWLGQHQAWQTTGKATATEKGAAAMHTSAKELYEAQSRVFNTATGRGMETTAVSRGGNISMSSITSGNRTLRDDTHVTKAGTSSLDENGSSIKYGNLLGNAALTGDKSLFESAAGGRNTMWSDRAHRLKAAEEVAGGLQKYGDLRAQGLTSAQAQAEVHVSGSASAEIDVGVNVPIFGGLITKAKQEIGASAKETLGTTSTNTTGRDETYNRVMKKVEELANDKNLTNDQRNTLLLKETSSIKNQIDNIADKGLVIRQVYNVLGPTVQGETGLKIK